MTGPMLSLLRTSNWPTFAARIASSIRLASSSSRVPSSWPFMIGNRTTISCCDASPYCCTTASLENASIAFRTASSATGWENFSTIAVPPVNSIPSGTPPLR